VAVINSLASAANSVNILFLFESLSFKQWASSMHISLHLNFFRFTSSTRATVGVVSRMWNLWRLSAYNSFSIIILRSSFEPIKLTVNASGNQFAIASYHPDIVDAGTMMMNGPGTRYW